MKLEDAKVYSDYDLEEMLPSKLLRVIIPHAMEYDRWVKSDPHYKWDMWVWLREAADECSACMGGAALAVRDDQMREGTATWLARVDHLRCGDVWEALTYSQHLAVEEGQVLPVARWYKTYKPSRSAADGFKWNAEVDPTFFAAYAAKLEENGL